MLLNCAKVSQISCITIQLDAEFHELQGRRNVITILTGGEKNPIVMGFKLMDDSPEGQEIPVGQIVVRADPGDEITVNGTKLKPTSTLAALLQLVEFRF